ncbi:MAG: leucyl-tRNA synthetase, partial [Pseudohongiellaceae bacterium]
KFKDACGTSMTSTDEQAIQEALQIIVLVLAPIVPHFSHSLWHYLGHDGAVMDAQWPLVDPAALKQDTVLIVVQVNGKLRAKLDVAKDIAKADLEALAMADEAVIRFTETGTVRKVIIVPGKLVNIVVN